MVALTRLALTPGTLLAAVNRQLCLMAASVGYDKISLGFFAQAPMPEPSVLDYLKAVARGRKLPAIPSLPKTGTAKVRRQKATHTRPRFEFKLDQLPWRSVGAFILFLIAQLSWAPPSQSILTGVIAAVLAIGLSVWASLEGEWRLPELEPAKVEKAAPIFRLMPLLFALFFFALTFLFSGSNRFNFVNVTSLVLMLVFVLAAFWQPRSTPRRLWQRWRAYAAEQDWKLHISRWTLVLLAAFALIAFFRFYHLASAPMEMNSDHAEKLLDVYDIQNGQPAIFFTRNSGREPFQFYMIDLVSKIFGSGLSFLSLKLSTTLIAFVSLIYIYLLGKELGGRRWVGLFALLLVGLAFWPNLLARVGLRFTLYPTFAAPVIYHLLRGLRRGSINDYLLAGVFMGIGLNGYTSFRIMPVVAGLAVLIYLLHRTTPELRRRALIGFALVALVSLVLFTPLLRYLIDNFSAFGERMLTRMGEAERPYPGSPALIFVQNVLRALAMFNFSGGKIWLVGLVDRPAFDLVSAALFLMGVTVTSIRYAQRRHWQDLFLLLAVPVLMLPSTLSLAFPEENPAMNRASGAWIPAFLMCAIGLDALLHGVRQRLGGKFGLRAAQLGGAAVLLIVAVLNFKLFFGDYVREYDSYGWNSSEMGQVIADYAGSFGSLDTAWVVAYPYWVDTRLVGIAAGNPGRDYAIWPDQLNDTLDEPFPKLFLLKPEDTGGLKALQAMYPQGITSLHQSRVVSKEFLIYLVPEATQ
jgi:4-amino-4-deoxy-L-arabinose transferase-like glycosyltransferase